MRGHVALGPVAALLLLSPAAAATPRTHVVVIDKMRFGALPADLRTGDIIVWDNRDLFRHTATAKDGSFNVDLPPAPRTGPCFGGRGHSPSPASSIRACAAC